MSIVSYNQKGYMNSSMSVRALEAYEGGEMPKSKWTKDLMLAAIANTADEYDIELTEAQFENIAKLTRNQIFENFFFESSWHHTGKFANETSFYSVDIDKLTDIVDEDISCTVEYFVDIYFKGHRIERVFSSRNKAKSYLKRNNFNPEKSNQICGGFAISTGDRLI